MSMGGESRLIKNVLVGIYLYITIWTLVVCVATIRNGGEIGSWGYGAFPIFLMFLYFIFESIKNRRVI